MNSFVVESRFNLVPDFRVAQLEELKLSLYRQYFHTSVTRSDF
jgi:hypothetical protein